MKIAQVKNCKPVKCLWDKWGCYIVSPQFNPSGALIKQKTAPHLLKDSDVKWLANVENRKKACMDLLARKGELGVLDSVSRWWNGQ